VREEVLNVEKGHPAASCWLLFSSLITCWRRETRENRSVFDEKQRVMCGSPLVFSLLFSFFFPFSLPTLESGSSDFRVSFPPFLPLGGIHSRSGEAEKVRGTLSIFNPPSFFFFALFLPPLLPPYLAM